MAVSHLTHLKTTSLSKKNENVLYPAQFPYGAICIYHYIIIYIQIFNDILCIFGFGSND